MTSGLVRQAAHKSLTEMAQTIIADYSFPKYMQEQQKLLNHVPVTVDILRLSVALSLRALLGVSTALVLRACLSVLASQCGSQCGTVNTKLTDLTP